MLDHLRLQRFDEAMKLNQVLYRLKIAAKSLSLIAFCTLTFEAQIAHTETLARIMPFANQAMITVYKSRLGGSDSDARVLFDSMNVPIQDGMMGPGKAIKDAGQILSWVCGDKGKDGYQCTFMIQKNARTKISSNPVRVRYEVSSTEAADLGLLVVPNQTDGTFKFTNEEGTLAIESSIDRFVITYAE